MAEICEGGLLLLFQETGKNKKVLKVVKLSGRYDILASIEKNYHIEAIKQIEAFKWLHG